MKILMVISEAPPITSGVSRVAEKLSFGLRERGYEIDILSLADIPRFELGELRLSSMPLKLNSLKQKFLDYDVINLHGPVPTFSDVFLLWGLRGLGTKRPSLVYTHHAPVDLRVFPLQPLIWAYNRTQEWLAHIADHVVVTTPSYGQRLSRFVPTRKLSVIPWGVDYDNFKAPLEKPGPFTVVYLGQIRPYKGLPVLIEAAKGMQDTRIWVIGNGHYQDACSQQAQKLGLENIHFFGRLPDDEAKTLLKQAHVIVLPSVTHSEAFGIVLLEGMAAGMVPVASHLPGVADLIGNEGFTFPPGNSEALRAVLTRLRDDQSLRLHLARLAQAKSKLYSWQRATFGYDRIFSRLVSPPYHPSNLLRSSHTKPMVGIPGSD